MTRRWFLRQSGRTLAVLPIVSSLPVLGRAATAGATLQSIPASVLKRIGITTVCFRDRFASTRGKSAEPLSEPVSPTT